MGRCGFNTDRRQANNTAVSMEQLDIKIGPGSSEQQAVWDVLLNTDKHVIVEAVAGSGKTYTITQYALREKQASVGLVAFNKHIADELTARMGGQSNVSCMTYHSLGYKACRRAFNGLGRPDEYRVLNILDTMTLAVPDKQEKVVKYKIKAVVSLAKNYGVSDRDGIEKLVDLHDMDLNGFNELVLDTAPKVMARCRQLNKGESIDFDDMVWLPMELGLAVPQFDVLCVDEYQDTGLTQQWLAVQGGKRVCAVGDPKQAIYAFRGADGHGFARLREQLKGNIVTLPLTLTRRCPKSHVRMAQQIVPQIQAMPDAPEGIVRVTKTVDEAVNEMRAGDLVVCRVNAELIGVAYKLLKRGVKAVVRGRDIGQGMVKLIEKGEKRCGGGYRDRAALVDVLKAIGEITTEEVAKYNAMSHGRGEMRAMNAQDRYECIVELAEGCGTVAELCGVIDKLFGDFDQSGAPRNAVVLGTVHRTKGLEGARVFVLRPDLIPHPMAKRKEEQEQERNLAYVAVTRAKFDKGTGEMGELVFVGGMCGLFNGEVPLMDSGSAYHEEMSQLALEGALDRIADEHNHAQDSEQDSEEPEWEL